MSKPIFLMKVPVSVIDQEGGRSHIETIQKGLESKLEDYHVLVMVEPIQRAEFECFNSSDAQDREIEEIKKEILDSIKSLKSR